MSMQWFVLGLHELACCAHTEHKHGQQFISLCLSKPEVLRIKLHSFCWCVLFHRAKPAPKGKAGAKAKAAAAATTPVISKSKAASNAGAKQLPTITGVRPGAGRGRGAVLGTGRGLGLATPGQNVAGAVVGGVGRGDAGFKAVGPRLGLGPRSAGVPAGGGQGVALQPKTPMTSVAKPGWAAPMSVRKSPEATSDGEEDSEEDGEGGGGESEEEEGVGQGGVEEDEEPMSQADMEERRAQNIKAMLENKWVGCGERAEGGCRALDLKP